MGMTLREVPGLNQPAAEKAVCVCRLTHATNLSEAAYHDLGHAEMPIQER
jgi:hypothetical protein